MDKSDAISKGGAPKPAQLPGVKSPRLKGAPRITDQGSSIVGLPIEGTPELPRIRSLSKERAKIMKNGEAAPGSSISKVAEAQIPKDESAQGSIFTGDAQEKKIREDEAKQRASSLQREITTFVDDKNLPQLKEKFRKERLESDLPQAQMPKDEKEVEPKRKASLQREPTTFVDDESFSLLREKFQKERHNQ